MLLKYLKKVDYKEKKYLPKMKTADKESVRL